MDDDNEQVAGSSCPEAGRRTGQDIRVSTGQEKVYETI